VVCGWQFFNGQQTTDNGQQAYRSAHIVPQRNVLGFRKYNCKFSLLGDKVTSPIFCDHPERLENHAQLVCHIEKKDN